MTAADLAREATTHRNRIVEIKANLYDLDAQSAAIATERADAEAELAEEQTVLATLEALEDAASEKPSEPEAAATPRRRSQGG